MTYCLTPQEFPFSSASPPPPPHTKGGRCGGGRGEVGRLSEPYGLTQSRVVVSVVSLASPPILWGLLAFLIKKGQGLGWGPRGRQRLTKPTTTFPRTFSRVPSDKENLIFDLILQPRRSRGCTLSLAKKGRGKALNPMYGKVTASAFQSGANNPMFGRTGALNPMYGKVSVNAKTIYIYSLDNELVQTFSSMTAAAKFLILRKYKYTDMFAMAKFFNPNI